MNVELLIYISDICEPFSIQVYVTNKRSYETFKDRLVINVVPAGKALELLRIPERGDFVMEMHKCQANGLTENIFTHSCL